MPYYERTVKSGPMVEVERYYATRGGKLPTRGARDKLTPEQTAKINERNAHRKLARLIMANFISGEDLFVTLTHKKVPTDDEARKAIGNMLRNLRNWCRKNGHPELRYISRTETGKRAHHHVILPGCCLPAVMKLWTHGRAITAKLDLSDGGAYALSHYIRKESDGDDKNQAPVFAKRWNASKNLIKPEAEPPKEISRINPSKPPKEVTGIANGAKKYAGLRLLEWAAGSGVFGDWQYLRMIRDTQPPEKKQRRRKKE